jgi:hypothetical protein
MEAIMHRLFTTLSIKELLVKTASHIQFHPIPKQTRQKVLNALKSVIRLTKKAMKTTRLEDLKALLFLIRISVLWKRS